MSDQEGKELTDGKQSGEAERFTLHAEQRPNFGSSAAGALRKAGKIPAVLYSEGEKPVSLVVTKREFVRAATRARTSQVFTFSSDAEGLNGEQAIVKEIQSNYVNGEVLHIDFQRLRSGRKVRVHVPLNVVGEPDGVRTQGGILAVAGRELVLECIPEAIPEMLAVDVTELKLGESVHASDIDLPQGTELRGNPGEAIASVVPSRMSRVQQSEASGAGEGSEAEAAAADGAVATEGEGS